MVGLKVHEKDCGRDNHRQGASYIMYFHAVMKMASFTDSEPIQQLQKRRKSLIFHTRSFTQ